MFLMIFNILLGFSKIPRAKVNQQDKWCESYGAERLIQVTEFGWRHFRWRKISQSRRHFRWRKISQGRRHNDYLDKSEIGSIRISERSSHQILSNSQKFFYWKQKPIFIVYLNKKDKNRHGPSKQFGPKTYK